jgi:holo-[acyl-carrier protein] synthase
MVRRLGQRFVRRLFTERELESAGATPGALRFAAKEAFLKALGTGLSSGIDWHAIEVLPSPGEDGLRIEVSGGVAAELLGGRNIRLSVSGSGRLSAAMVTIDTRGEGGA